MEVEYRDESKINWMVPLWGMFFVAILLTTGEWFKYMVVTASYLIILILAMFKFAKSERRVQK